MRSKLFCILTTILIVTLLLGLGVVAFAMLMVVWNRIKHRRL